MVKQLTTTTNRYAHNIRLGLQVHKYTEAENEELQV